MELYNKEFVYFDWDDKLEGKKGFFGDNINHLKLSVKDNRTLFYGEICHNVNTNTDYPFGFIDESGSAHCFRFCYYDPYYEFRKAYLEDKQLQFKNGNGNWEDVRGELVFNGDEYRIKPEDDYEVGIQGRCPKFVIHNVTTTGVHIPTYCFFKGTHKECIKWCEEHRKVIDVMQAWEYGKTVEVFDSDKWHEVKEKDPEWFPTLEYRIKPDTYVPFDSVEGLINAWDEKYPQNKNRPKGTMPLIWIKSKEKNRVYLITDFLFEKAYNCDVGTEDENLKLKELFEDYTFADGSIIGKVKE